MKGTAWKALGVCLGMALAGVAAAAPKKAAIKLGPPARLAVPGGVIVSADELPNTRAKGGDRTNDNLALPAAGPQEYLVLHAEFGTPEAARALILPNLHVFSRYGKWIDAFFPVGDDATFKGVATAPGVVWVELGRVVALPPPPVPKTAVSRAQPEPIVRGGVSGLTGKGVVVAVVDSGIDFRHPDFITRDASGKPVSRIRAIWDTVAQPQEGKPGKPGPIAYPNGAPVGTVYTQEALTAELQSGGTAIPQLDTNGHGTACAGIAAGNGTALPERRFTGVAPDAEIIGVRIGPGPGLPNSYLIGAVCDWLETMAGSRPMVVSCSFGGQYGGRDGQRVQERQLSARFAPEVKGRALCISAGNEGANPIHAEVSFSDEKNPGLLNWSVPREASGGKLEIYLDSADANVTVRTTPGTGPDLTKARAHKNPFTGQVVWSVDLKPGDASLQLSSGAGATRKADAYVYAFGSVERAVFTGPSAALGKQVGTPGTTVNAVTVGSYDWNNELESAQGPLVLADTVRTASDGKPAPLTIGGLSTYSCPGYVRTGDTVKPDLAAPGQYHIVPAITQGARPPLHASGKYRAFNGTSASTPYVAGIVALMLQKKPDLTSGEIRGLLHKGATQDRYTGAVPNPRWGHGKLDLPAVQRVIAGIR